MQTPGLNFYNVWYNYVCTTFHRRKIMATKKEAAHDCKKDCEILHKEIAALKKEVAALQKKCDACCAKQAKGGGGADPRVDKILKALEASPKILRALNEQ